MTEKELSEIMYEVCDSLDVSITHEESELIMHYSKAIKRKLKAGQNETIVMWRSVEDELPESEEEEYAVTDGQSFYMAYFGFNHKTKKTEFSSTSDDFNSLYGCKGITHWAKIDDSVIIDT